VVPVETMGGLFDMGCLLSFSLLPLTGVPLPSVTYKRLLGPLVCDSNGMSQTCPLPIDQGERIALGGIVRLSRSQVKRVSPGEQILSSTAREANGVHVLATKSRSVEPNPRPAATLNGVRREPRSDMTKENVVRGNDSAEMNGMSL